MDAIVGKKLTVAPAAARGRRPPRAHARPRGAGRRRPAQVVSATAEQMFLDITPEQAARLPRYKGDLLLTEHSAGSLTSQTIHEALEPEERAARRRRRARLGGRGAGWAAGPIPATRLNDAWELVLGGQMHDILPGTATAEGLRVLLERRRDRA